IEEGERAYIERLISISRYRGIRHQDGSPLRVNELILMQGLLAANSEMKEGYRRTSNGFRAIPC
ncbi:hypothetical protein ZWY2020_007399, partial [Hordeum vulgare]